jgi:hypothetical protein
MFADRVSQFQSALITRGLKRRHSLQAHTSTKLMAIRSLFSGLISTALSIASADRGARPAPRISRSRYERCDPSIQCRAEARRSPIVVEPCQSELPPEESSHRGHIPAAKDHEIVFFNARLGAHGSSFPEMFPRREPWRGLMTQRACIRQSPRHVISSGFVRSPPVSAARLRNSR